MPESRQDMTVPDAAALAAVHERFRRDDLVVSVATRSEFAEVEALARAADPHEIFRPLTARLIAWFVEENPFGPGFLVVARPTPGGPVVGHFLFYANRLVHVPLNALGERAVPEVGTPLRGDRAAASEIPAYLYVHLYVAPDYRRRGVFAAMFAFGLQVLKAMGVPFAYTVPNPRSSPGFVKFGVPLLGMLPVRMAPAHAAWGALSRVSAPGARAMAVERVERFDETMLQVADCGGGAVRGARSVAGLEWRFPQRPDAEYAVWKVHRGGACAGYAVTRVLEIQAYRVLAICDVALDRFDPGTVGTLVREVRRQERAQRPSLVMLQGGPPALAAQRALARAGLVKVPNRFLPQPVAVFGGAPGESGSTSGLPTLDRWCFTPCDWDVF